MKKEVQSFLVSRKKQRTKILVGFIALIGVISLAMAVN